MIKDGLTLREVEIWSLIAKGLNNSAISKTLNVSISTLDRHVGSLLSKTKPFRTDDNHPRVWLAINYLIMKE